MYTALTICFFRFKVLRFFPRLVPFRAIALRIPTCYIHRLIRDREAHIHKLNFFFVFLFGDLSFARLLKIRAKYLEKTILSVKETANVERHSR